MSDRKWFVGAWEGAWRPHFSLLGRIFLAMVTPMKRLPTWLAAGILLAATGAAQERNFQIFSDRAYEMNENLDAVLGLTPEQEQRLAEAQRAWREDPAVAEAHAAFVADEAKKQEFYETKNAAEQRFREAVGSILTPSQQELVEKINAVAMEAWRELEHIETWPERTAKMREIGPDRLRAVLSSEQAAKVGLGSGPGAPSRYAPSTP